MEEPQEVPRVFIFKVVCLAGAQHEFCRPVSHSVLLKDGELSALSSGHQGGCHQGAERCRAVSYRKCSETRQATHGTRLTGPEGDLEGLGGQR